MSAWGRVLNTIVLLTGVVEAPYLSARLKELASSLRVLVVSTLADLVAVPGEVLAHARLVSFATGVVVPGSVLRQLGYGAYNFHPGPPAYPGLMPAQLAIYQRSTEFGVTAHAMAERVDAGPIVGAITFRAPPDPTVEVLELLSFGELLRLFWQLAPLLAASAEPLAELPLRWGTARSTRRSMAALAEIAPDISAEELERRVAAFAGNLHGLIPTITLHGHRFRLVAEPATPVAVASAPEPKIQALAS